MTLLKGWPFETINGIPDEELCGGGESGGGSPG